MAPGIGRAVRQRKLGPKQDMPILREGDLEPLEYKELIRIRDAETTYETGVEKSEENELHLQAALANNGGHAAEVPAPPTIESADIQYDKLYSAKLPHSNTYIKFSLTVEECTGCQYNMTTADDAFLTAYNASKPAAQQCSEDDFERIMEFFEKIAGEEIPFAAVDNTVLSLETMEKAMSNRMDKKLQAFAKDIFEHWRARRRDNNNKSLQPSLKFETHQENDDGDPYVCFRRRDVRQTRKTRARDVQSTDKLRRLRREIEDGRGIASMAHTREIIKRSLFASDKAIFGARKRVKETKRRLGIKNDDGDLINERPQRRRREDVPQLSRPGQQMRAPARLPDGRQIETDMVQLQFWKDQKENEMNREIASKVEQHKAWNKNHIDLTRAPLSPVDGQDADSAYRPATTAQYPITPPASAEAETPLDESRAASPSPERQSSKKRSHDEFRYASPPEDRADIASQPAYRRRIGRDGRLFIDRKHIPRINYHHDEDEDVEMENSPFANNPSANPWKKQDPHKYDHSDDEDSDTIVVDAYSMDLMRFRSKYPYTPMVQRRPVPLEQPGHAGNAANAQTPGAVGATAGASNPVGAQAQRAAQAVATQRAATSN